MNVIVGQKTDKKETLIVQSNDLIESKFDLSLNQLKLWLYVVSMIDYNDTEITRYRVFKKDFLVDIGDVRGTRYTELRKSIKDIQSKVITRIDRDWETL